MQSKLLAALFIPAKTRRFLELPDAVMFGLFEKFCDAQSSTSVRVTGSAGFVAHLLGPQVILRGTNRWGLYRPSRLASITRKILSKKRIQMARYKIIDDDGFISPPIQLWNGCPYSGKSDTLQLKLRV